jgi:hypothetical protein
MYFSSTSQSFRKELYNFLLENGFEEFYDRFILTGVETIKDTLIVEEADLEEIGMTKLQRKKFLLVVNEEREKSTTRLGELKQYMYLYIDIICV